MRQGPPPTVSVAIRWAVTAATRIPTAGRASARAAKKCADIAMAEPLVERSGAERARPSISVWLACAGAALAALLPPGCLERRDVTEVDPEVARCTSCHGDPARGGDPLLSAAPPYDLLRQTLPGYPGVGAHQIHLNAGPTHAALACDE